MNANNKTNHTFLLTAYSLPLLSVFLMLSLLWGVSGCKDDDGPEPIPYTGISDSEIIIGDVAGIPSDVTFDRVEAEIQGVCWEVIASVEAPYENERVILTLPASFSSDKLQQVDCSDKNPCGHWRAACDDPDALVASLGDIIAYKGETVVGRIYLTDWPGEGSMANRIHVYYHFADRPFTLSGYNYALVESEMFKSSFLYSATFRKGWNAYAYINPSNPGQTGSITTCTTTIPEEKALHWRFKSRVY